MSMRSRTSKKMRGFMCQSPAATAVCMATDSGSVVVPRRSTNQRAQIDHRRLNLINNGKYTRLAVDDKRADFVPCMKREQDPEHLPKPPLQKPPSIASSDTVFQVVVMRVSIHCQGCAGKLKKHLSKMEGVTSFSIDVEAKRVTVMGHVSPVGVLESVSKVKKAEFWPC